MGYNEGATSSHTRLHSLFLTSSTLTSLRFFAAAARHLSFKEAAQELHVTQGAVSQQIKHLERALECKLFYRLTRRISLTEEGARFAATVTRALEEIEQGAQAIAGGHKDVAIRVRVGPSLALRWLVPRLGEFYQRHPEIKLFVVGAYGHFDPARREFDLAVEAIRGKVAALQSEFLMDEYLVPVCSPTYLREHRFLKEPADLARCTLLHDAHAWTGEREDAEWRHWLQEVGATHVDSKQGQFFTLANMSTEAALTDQGVAMGRLSLVRDLIAAGRLVAPFQQVKSRQQYCLLYPKELAGRPGMQAVIRWLHEQAQKANDAAGPGLPSKKRPAR